MFLVPRSWPEKSARGAFYAREWPPGATTRRWASCLLQESKSVSFLHTGVDYAGPFLLKTGHPRRPIEVKGYLAVFVCLATKAVHLEVVSSKTTEAFIATLKRFICRRNVPQHIYSDNGSNFVGARNELKELFNFLSLPNTQIAIKEALLEQRIEWHFIPDRAPHFSGIWEAAVKSAKYCLKRAIRKTMLSYEKLTTVFCQAEACLNSRPYLSQDSHSPAGEMPLTPGHFLTGRPLGVYPESPEPPDLTLNNRWVPWCRSSGCCGRDNTSEVSEVAQGPAQRQEG